MKKLLSIVVVLMAMISASAQYNLDYNNSRDYYNDDFDWRWDVRVRITEGINNGLITRWEANRLYNRLERIEEKEYTYAADGVYEAWEQDDVWNDVQWLHAQVGLELRDNDRVYYGYTRPGVVFYGYPTWWYRGGYRFNRFDRLGYGSVRYGYTPRYYVPNYRNNVYVYRYPHRERNVYRGNRSSSNNDRYTNRSPRKEGRSNSYENNNRSRSYERNSVPNRSYDRGNDNGNSRRSSSIEDGNRKTSNRSESRSREYTRPTTPERTATAPSRVYSGRTESMSPSRGSSTQRSAPSRSYEHSSSSSSRGSSSVGGSSLSSSRTKVPESQRSSSRRGSQEQ